MVVVISDTPISLLSLDRLTDQILLSATMNSDYTSAYLTATVTPTNPPYISTDR